MIDLDDTRNCPTMSVCEGCGMDNELDLGTVETPLGVACVTVCATCAREPADGWRWNINYAALRVRQHCLHLGVDLDQMAEAIEATNDH